MDSSWAERPQDLGFLVNGILGAGAVNSTWAHTHRTDRLVTIHGHIAAMSYHKVVRVDDSGLLPSNLIHSMFYSIIMYYMNKVSC